MMPYNWLYHFVKTTYLGKSWFSFYRPKCSTPIRFQNFLNFNFSKTTRGIIFLHVVEYPWEIQLSHVLFVGIGQACPGMPNLLQVSIFPGRVRVNLFVACSYKSTETTLLPCQFSRIWPCLPKILQNNKLPISVGRVDGFC